ncbi:type 1 glutamine amidotransferase domain-containing protein [Hyphococcus luteus]|uniref:Protease n=1 Tax=Hyphococcus luteus TaxID=2058213 RepID=A0A2S7K3G8_9PROT|nr:type 1 glutamine amidotransferase domain-containing protein [Marinicaulis flavus]PQA87050.1 protease [Marinicaulis flavus]
MAQLENRKIAILAADGFEESELFSPLKALKEAGASVDIVSIKTGSIQGFRHTVPLRDIRVDKTLEDADINDYDGLLIPGGLFNPDALRRDEKALAFVRGAFAKNLPVAAICHGPQVLISAGVVEGRKMTGFEAIQIDLENAGAEVSDTEVVVDEGLVTSRNPDDLDAFNKKIIEEFCEGKHARQKKSVAA